MVAGSKIHPLTTGDSPIAAEEASPADQLSSAAEPQTPQPEATLEVVDRQPQRKDSELSAEAIEMAKRAKSTKYHKKWIGRLKIFFCCLGYKKNKDSIADVASIFAELYADLDVPSKDIAAGFVLLSKYQDAQRQWIVQNQQMGVESYLSSVPITEQTKFLDLATAEDSHLINELIYYMNYGLAIFGWPMQVIDDPCMLCCIYPHLRIAPCCSSSSGKSSKDKKAERVEKRRAEREAKKESGKSVDDSKAKPASRQVESDANDTNKNDLPQQPKTITSQPSPTSTVPPPTGLTDGDARPIVLEDNCCGCNMASAERRLASHNYEVIYVSYKVNVHVIPFLVAADHSKQSIVVALRGSMSLSDMITDLNGQTDKLPIENCPDDWLCHRGITRAATHVQSKLLKENILDRAFNCRPDLGSQDYTLILCGHSLGAGAAAILGILLRPQYPTLKAYLYAPPGGILSLPVVEYTKKFATGIFLGNDCVPRLGIAQLERLRYHVLLSLKSSQASSGKVLARALCPSSCCFGNNEVEHDPELSLNVLYGTSGRSFDYNGSKIPFQVQPQVLYVPGRLIHIVKNHNFKSRSRSLFKEPIYQAVWNDNTLYDRVAIGEGMFYDHLPNKLHDAMKMLFSKTLPARRESRLSPSLDYGDGNISTSPAYPSLDDHHHHNLPNDFSDRMGKGGQILSTGEAADKLEALREDKFTNGADSNNNQADENNNKADDSQQNNSKSSQNHATTTPDDTTPIAGDLATISRLNRSKLDLDNNGNDETEVDMNQKSSL